MPCGFKDQRRAGHRCVRCREEHTRCDGKRPCAMCQRRGYQCLSPTDTSTKVSFVAYRNIARQKQYHNQQSISSLTNGLKHDEWLYSRIFFDSTSSSISPVMHMFSFESIGLIFQKSPLIQSIVALVGETYIAHQNGLSYLSDRQRQQLRRSACVVRAQVLKEMSTATTANFTVALLSACLLGFLELSEKYNNRGWTFVIRKTREFVIQHRPSSIPRDALEDMLHLHARMADAVRCICFGEDIPMPDSWMTMLDPGPGPQPAASTVEQHLNILADYIELWARLRYSSVSWIIKEQELHLGAEKLESSTNVTLDTVTYFNDKTSHVNHTLEGIDLVCFASKLQRAIINALFAYSSGHGHPHLPNETTTRTRPSASPTLQNVFQPYYHWALAGISQLFRVPAWQSLGCELPRMNNVLIHEQAVMALDLVERRANHLEAIVFAPVLSIIGVEMTSKAERERIIRHVNTLKNKGFGVLSTLECELRGIWRHKDKLSESGIDW